MIGLDDILHLMKRREPFAVARFNDGEMAAIRNSMDVVSRGDQDVTPFLAAKLKEALTHRQHNYFVGLPDVRYGRDVSEALTFVGDYENITSSVVFHDNNWAKALRELPRFASHFNKIGWVGGNTHATEKLPIRLSYKLTVGSKNGADDYDKVKNFTPQKGDLVFVSCGPLGRILTKEWFERQPRCTILEVGSVFDPVVQNVWRKYQKKRRREALSVINSWQNG